MGCLVFIGLFAEWFVVLFLLFGLDALAKLLGGRKPYKTDYGPYYEEQRLVALRRDNYTCQLCGRPAEVTHHIHFRGYGGSDDASNLVSLCRACHQRYH